MPKFLEKLEKYILSTTVLLTPLVFAPIFPEVYLIPKMIVLATGLGLYLIVKSVNTIRRGSLELGVGEFDLPIVILVVAYVVSSVLKTANRAEAFFFPGTATVLVLSTLIYFFVNQNTERDKKTILTSYFLGGVISATLSIFANLGVLSKIPQLPAFVKDVSFNTEGSLLSSALIFALLMVIGVIMALKERGVSVKLFYVLSFVILFIGLGTTIYNMLPGKPNSPKLASMNVNWSIAVDALKESPLLGIGPGNYLTAFNIYRPLSYNQTDIWQVRFTSGRSFYLTLLTETGFLGLAGIVFLGIAVFKKIKKEVAKKEVVQSLLEGNWFLIPLSLLLVSLTFLPYSLTTLLALSLLLSLSGATRYLYIPLSSFAPAGGGSRLATKVPTFFATLPILVGFGVFAYFFGRSVLAEYKYQKALTALSQNDGLATYNLLREAITLGSQVDRYHATYTQVNLALASSLVQNRGENLTDQDRQTVTQLIQQAIREGKATVSLNPRRSGNWELLGRTYRDIMAFAEGAADFSIQSFTQAVALDPINPNARLALGGVYYATGKYDDAIRAFELATLAKNDFANAHYNLAIALREKGEIERAISELNTTLSLVDPNSNDFNLIKTEIENLEAKRPAKEAGESANLTPPQEAPEQIIQPPVELPEEAPPPSPEPTPETEEEVTPQP